MCFAMMTVSQTIACHIYENLYDDDDVELHVLGCRLTYWGQNVTSAEAWFNVALRPQKP